MVNSEVKLSLKQKGLEKEQTGVLNISAGASTIIKFEDYDVDFQLNYDNPDSLIASFNGRFKFINTDELKLFVKGGLSRDFLKEKNIYEGKLLLEFDKNIKTNLKAIYDTKKGVKCMVGIEINF